MKILFTGILTGLLVVAATATPPAHISCKIARSLQAGQTPNLFILDIRSTSEFQQEHISGALNVPAAQISQSSFPSTAALVVYCNEGSCPLSENAANALVTVGYSNVRVLDGGLAGWKQLGFPVDSSISAHVGTILSKDLVKNLGNSGPAILDVRTAPEFLSGHLPGAVNIPLETLSSSLAVVSAMPNWVVYDRQGVRAHTAATLIAAQGLDVRELVGGIAAWAGDRYPLEVGAASPQR